MRRKTETQMLSMLAYVADVERNKNLERQLEGIAVAQAKGVKFGRPSIGIREAFIWIYNAWKIKEITATAACKELGVSRTTFYKKVNEYERFRIQKS